MFLGQVLDRLRDEAFATETLLGLDDLPLMVEIETAGRDFGESATDYAVHAVRRFAALAGDEDWQGLMTALERADDTAAACLRHMLAWALRHDRDGASGCCSHGHCHEHGHEHAHDHHHHHESHHDRS